MSRSSVLGLLVVATVAGAGVVYVDRDEPAPLPAAPPPQPVVQVAPPVVEAVPETPQTSALPPDMFLTGVVLNSDERKSAAWIEDSSGPAKRYGPGNTVGDGYVLKTIRPSNVLLEKAGETFLLVLGRASGDTGVQSAGPSSRVDGAQQALAASPDERRAMRESRREQMAERRREGSKGAFGGSRKNRETFAEKRQRSLEAVQAQPQLLSEPDPEVNTTPDEAVPAEPEPEPVETATEENPELPEAEAQQQ